MRHVKRLNPELVKLYRGRVESYERVVGERRPDVLRTAAVQAEQLVEEVLS